MNCLRCGGSAASEASATKKLKAEEELVHLQLMPKSLFQNKDKGLLLSSGLLPKGICCLSPTHLPPCLGKNLSESHLALRRKQYRKSQQQFLAQWFIRGAGFHPSSLTLFLRGSKPCVPSSLHLYIILAAFAYSVSVWWSFFSF